MQDPNDALDALFTQADSEAWQELMAKGQQNEDVGQDRVADSYLAAFDTPAGRAVLKDMYQRYVHVTRAVPGQGADAAFYREGMAQVVFDIVAQMKRAEKE